MFLSTISKCLLHLQESWQNQIMTTMIMWRHICISLGKKKAKKESVCPVEGRSSGMGRIQIVYHHREKIGRIYSLVGQAKFFFLPPSFSGAEYIHIQFQASEQNIQWPGKGQDTRNFSKIGILGLGKGTMEINSESMSISWEYMNSDEVSVLAEEPRVGSYLETKCQTSYQWLHLHKRSDSSF